MERAGAKVAAQQSAKGPWQVAWVLLIPLALWLALGKTTLVMHALLAMPRDDTDVVAFLKWFWWFISLRVLLALLAGYAIQRLVMPRQRWAFVPIAAAILVALAMALALLRPGPGVVEILQMWFATATEQVLGLMACLWRDVVSVALMVLGLVLQLAPARAQRGTVRGLQLVVVLLCALVGIDLAHQFATGQPASSRTLLFAVFNMRELAPLIASEATPYRALAIVGGIVSAAAWAWRQRALASMPLLAGPRAYAESVVALPLGLAILLPTPPHELMPLLRHTEGTLIALAKTAAPSVARDVQTKVEREFDRAGKPRWHSAHMAVGETDVTKRRNVVIVMLESVRAVSTTLHTPALRTTPFLKRLASESLVVQDMTAVIPRTAAAWMAVLGGQYPLANESTMRWAEENRKVPRIRSLPSILRDAGYATSFFTPTDLHFQSDVDVIGSFNFEFVRTERDLAPPGAERITYFGVADELMVQPILDWTAVQAQARRPFFTAIMTNVGHHDFKTPSTWPMIRFEGVSDPDLQAYYNCLRYIDGVLSTLIEGYRRLGVLDDTIFVFVGDHGQMFDEHDAKHTYNAVYQEGLHVPAMIYAPGLGLAAGTVRGPRQQIDILPTVLDLLGYRIEGAELPGQSLLQPVEADRKLFYTSSIDWSFLTARRGPRKYIYSFDRQPMEVFDLDRDPGELKALRNVDPEELATMKREMLEWRAHAQLSMLARPSNGSNPSSPWMRK